MTITYQNRKGDKKLPDKINQENKQKRKHENFIYEIFIEAWAYIKTYIITLLGTMALDSKPIPLFLHNLKLGLHLK